MKAIKFDYDANEAIRKFLNSNYGSKPMSVLSQIKTQKARGIYAAATEVSNLTNGAWSVEMPTSVTVVVSDGIIGAPVRSFPLFARPCPIRPRHGFVESRVVQGFDDLSTVWQEARAADKEAELVLMPILTGQVSSVATGSGVAWGKGHAGATSGNGARYIPCPENSQNKWKNIARFQSDIGIKTCPYAEIVEHHATATLVQLRDGPSLPSAVNFVPSGMHGMIVNRVLTLQDLGSVSEDDANALLVWEGIVASFRAANEDGLVLYLPGKTLGSHFAVHGIASNLPVICEGEVTVGKPLEVASDVAPLKPKDLQTIGRMMFDARAAKMSQNSRVAKQAVATLHALGTWGGDKHLLALRAEMPVILARYISAACLGELRHWFQRCGPGWHGIDLRTDMPNPPTKGSHQERDSAYTKAFKLEWEELAPLMKTARLDFECGNWSSNYGGRAWARCARAAYYIEVAVDRFIHTPTEKKFASVLKACNAGVNVAHNGGKVLTKWLSSSQMEDMSKLPVLGFLSSSIGQKITSI